MRYKGTAKSLTEIGKELGVSHILEGSVQRGTERIRIVGQLIDTQTDEHIWAETYDNLISDLFDILSIEVFNFLKSSEAFSCLSPSVLNLSTSLLTSSPNIPTSF